MKTLRKFAIIGLLTGMLFSTTSCMLYGPPEYGGGMGIYLRPHNRYHGYYGENYGRYGHGDRSGHGDRYGNGDRYRDRDRDRD